MALCITVGCVCLATSNFPTCDLVLIRLRVQQLIISFSVMRYAFLPIPYVYVTKFILVEIRFRPRVDSLKV
jgi:hypothetical protein